MKKSVVLFIVALFFGAGILFAATAPKGDFKIKKTGSIKKIVVFNHEKHATIEKANDCKSCHEAVKAKSDAHALCLACHSSQEKGPRKCTECHKAE